MAGPNRPVAGEQIVKADWVRRAVRLAIRGWSLRRIAERVDRHHTTVAEALDKEFERVRPSTKELETAQNLHREKLLRREERLNHLIAAHWPSAKTDVERAKVVVDAEKGLDRVHHSLARLDGYDAPKRSELSGYGGSPIQFVCNGLTDDQLERLASIDAGDAAGAAGRGESGTGETGEGGGEAPDDR
jgi:hypothetical protein